MVKTYIVNAQVYIEHLFVEKTICIEDGEITLLPADICSRLEKDSETLMCERLSSDGKAADELAEKVCNVFDAAGMKAVPGFIDIHTHGAAGVDVNGADEEGLVKMARFFAEHGVTSWLASVLTDTEEQTVKVLEACKGLLEKQNGSECTGGNCDSLDIMCSPMAELLGVHLEGPFLASEYKGAMPEELLKMPDGDLLEKYRNATERAIRYITISPELEGAAELAETAKELGITVGIGHSGATYEQAMKAIEAGATVGTHVGNAMKLIHQHEPAIFGALLESDCYCEVIADGRHLHPGMLKILAKVKGTERLIAVTDSIMAAGLPDGNYKLGVNDIVVTGGDAKLAKEGTRAGSTLTLDAALRNIIDFTGLALEDVVPMLTENPAKAIGVFGRKGSIADGKDADIVLLDGDNNVCHVFARGRQVL